jgi:Flp pilus assembly protein TadG
VLRRLRAAGRVRGHGLAEFAVTSLAVVGLIVGVADVALWLHAQNVVIAAAQEAAAVASREGGSPEQAQHAAQDLLQAGLGAEAAGIQPAQVTIGSDTVSAEVRGTWRVALLGPLVSVPLHAQASMVREEFRPWGR